MTPETRDEVERLLAQAEGAHYITMPGDDMVSMKVIDARRVAVVLRKVLEEVPS